MKACRKGIYRYFNMKKYVSCDIWLSTDNFEKIKPNDHYGPFQLKPF